MSKAPIALPETMPEDPVARDSTELEIRRLRWQCRRGLLELDLILGPFLDRGYGALDDAQRMAFVRLLAEQDQRLSDWFLSRSEPPDPTLRDLVARILRVVRAG